MVQFTVLAWCSCPKTMMFTLSYFRCRGCGHINCTNSCTTTCNSSTSFYNGGNVTVTYSNRYFNTKGRLVCYKHTRIDMTLEYYRLPNQYGWIVHVAKSIDCYHLVMQVWYNLLIKDWLLHSKFGMRISFWNGFSLNLILLLLTETWRK